MPTRCRGPRTALVILLASVALPGCDNAEPDRSELRIPELSGPPPAPAARAENAPPRGPARFRVVLRDVGYTLPSGTEIDLPEVEAVVVPPSGAGGGAAVPTLHVPRLRLSSPRIVAHPSPGSTGLPLFVELEGLRILVDRFIVRDGSGGTRTAGRWLWHLADVDLRVRDLRFGGDLRDIARVARLSVTGEVDGRPLRVTSTGATLRRLENVLHFEAGLDLGLSHLRVQGRVYREGGLRLTVRADPLRFAELRAFAPELPRAGTGEGVIHVRSRDGRTVFTVDSFEVRVDSSRLALAGTFVTDGGRVLRDVVLELSPLYAQDLEQLTGIELPFDGRLSGRIRASGGARRGIEVGAELALRREGGAVSKLAIDGEVRLEPEPRLDLRLTAEPLRLADTAFTATLRVRGRPDSLRLRGTVALLGQPGLRARLRARLLDPAGEPPRVVGQARLRLPPAAFGAGGAGAEPVAAVAEGRVVLAPGGEISVRIRADSLPLALVPFPERIEVVGGFARARVTIGGTLDAPTLRGRVRLREGGLRVEPLGLRVTALRGELRLRDDAVVVERLRARAGGGTLAAEGRVALADPPRLDLRLELERVRVLDRDSAVVVLSGGLRLGGPVTRPRVTGAVTLVDGYVYEDVFSRSAPLDIASPPFAELARRVPWPDDSPLLTAVPDDDEPPPVRGEVVVRVLPNFTVIDEDSELYGRGRVVVRADEAGIRAEGLVRLEGGVYAFFGERFRVVGGAVRFTGGETLEPHITLLATHIAGVGVGGGWGTVGEVGAHFPPLQFFATGPVSDLRQEIRRPSLLPETRAELVELLLYGVPPEPVTGWRNPLFWLADGGSETWGERAAAQGTSLLWSYTADELYDYVPRETAYLRAGMIAVGSGYPNRRVIGALLRVGVVVDGGIELLLGQPMEGNVAPGLRVRFEIGRGGTLVLLHEPRFFADAPTERDGTGFFHRRKTGLGVRWEWEF